LIFKQKYLKNLKKYKVKPKITKRQLIAIINLLQNLKDIQAKGLATYKDIITMVNFISPNSIFLRYEKIYDNGGEQRYEYKIAEIDEFGNTKFIDDKFQNIFERYSFLGECKTFDIENPLEYEKVD
tara:strand:+ start:10079 stop:10456 length:378 start_codon:yes stop_codon:yes gene_type:complete